MHQCQKLRPAFFPLHFLSTERSKECHLTTIHFVAFIVLVALEKHLWELPAEFVKAFRGHVILHLAIKRPLYATPFGEQCQLQVSIFLEIGDDLLVVLFILHVNDHFPRFYPH